MHDFNAGFAAGDSDLVAGRMAQMAEVRPPRTTDSAGFGLARNSLDPSAANQLKPAGFFERLDSRQMETARLIDCLRNTLLATAEKIGAPQYPPAAPQPPACEQTTEACDAVSNGIRRADLINTDLDFLLGLAGRIAERL